MPKLVESVDKKDSKTLKSTTETDEEKHKDDIKQTIKKKNSQLKQTQESIHIVLYCIKYHQRTFLDKEPDVIKELLNLNVKIFLL